jgi:hypothetical protein
VDPPVGGIQIGKIPCITGIFGNGLQPEIVDVGRTEAPFMFDFHGVKGASVRIDTY